MDKLDDALFDLANRCKEDKERSAYFESMRVVRVKRASIETAFRHFFKESVRSTIERLGGSRPGSSQSGAASAELTLVDKDDLEEALAVTNMVAKIRGNCMQSLYALELRIAELLSVDELVPADNPFGPEAMCNAFKDACAQIDARVEVRLIILEQFHRHVGEEAGNLFIEINEYLISQKVLPTIRHHVKVQPSSARATNNPAHEHHGSGPQSPGIPQSQSYPGGAVLLDALRQVMDANFASGTGAQTLSDNQHRVISQLTHLQHADARSAWEELPRFDVSAVHTGTVNVLRDLKQTQAASGISEMDAIMFDIVAMMFDVILDDNKIPAPMRALIGRLQIPMLKVAILDKALFTRKYHPARKFLNTIAKAAIGWSEDKDRNDALYGELESMVGRLLDEFDEGVDVFAGLLCELEAFLALAESQAETNASTIAHDIQGRERLTLARRNAEQAITQCLGRANIDESVREFLIDHWKELLFIRYFEEGDTGEGWTSAVQTMEDLVWSIAPKTLDQDRDHLKNILPGLLLRLREGMEQSGFPAKLSGNFLGVLKALQIAAIQPGASAHDGKAGSHLDSPSTDFQWPDSSSFSASELSVLQLAMERANDVIYGTAEARPECAGMGTTIVAVQLQDDLLTAAHVGDARLYRMRGNVFRRLTSDHSLGQQFLDKGICTSEEVADQMRDSIIARTVGPQSSVDVEVQKIAVERDDLYLLCSDGLSDMVADAALARILCDHPTELATAGRILVDTANENGGRDNISVVLVRVVDTCPEVMGEGGSLNSRLKLDMYGLSDVGRTRSHNEDHIALDPEHGIAIVADGMGGCGAGELASELAVKIVLDALRDGNADATSSQTTRTSRPATEAAYALEEEDEYTDIVRDLEVGSWVEFHHVDGATTPARLSWSSPVTGRYLFTDRNGMKVADATIHGLAVEMKRGNVALIEDVPLFDRIIGTITENLHADGAKAH
jgi:serine/threonine protein phosphatase PrpC